MKVPFLDLKVQYLSMKDEIHAAIQEVLDATAFAGGPFVARFEKEFASFCGCQEGIGVGSGTEALWLCLLALGIGPGDAIEGARIQDSGVRTQLPALGGRQSAVSSQESGVRNPQLETRNPKLGTLLQSAIRIPQSAIGRRP
jgi:hypothetical protein